jgi:hypothetical protein
MMCNSAGFRPIEIEACRYEVRTIVQKFPEICNSVVTSLVLNKIGLNTAPTPRQTLPNTSRMTKTISKVKQATSFLCECPTMNVPQAMRAAGFTDEQAKNRTLQMRVRRHHKEEVTSVPSSVPLTPDISPMSPLTAATEDASTTTTSTRSNNTPTSSSSSSIQLSGTKRIRHTAKQSQQDKVNKKRENCLIKKAHKKVTILLASERKKKQGMGARKIALVRHLPCHWWRPSYS